MEGITVSSYLFRGRLFDGDLLALDGVFLFEHCGDDLFRAENDKGKASRPARHGVHLQVDRRHLAERGEVFPDVLL